ncbi:MAG: urea transport system permease protein [Solirubrobacteraceae bacterium]|nr:urea transport system permease protein [Solirubrobacteraceae bacterium]
MRKSPNTPGVGDGDAARPAERNPASGRSRAVRALVTAAVLVVAVVIVPAVLTDFSLGLTTLFLPFAMLAISIDLLWGENRLISFGHGAFFAAGGYIGGLVLLGRPYDVVSGATSFLETSTKQPLLNRVLETLHDISIAGIPIPALLLPPLITGVVGLVIGLIVFRVADPEIYLPLITLGIGVVAGIWFNELKPLGASNGLGGVPAFTKDIGTGQSVHYLFNLAFLFATLGLYWRFRQSPRGSTWRALGDDPVRLEALGYPVRRMRAYGFAVSCALAGLAGSLYAATSGFMGPSVASVSFSAQALIWVAVGGVGTVLGPVVGTLVVKWGEQLLSSNLGLQDSWPLFLGLLLILVVVVAPGGIMGLRRGDLRLPRRRRAGAAAPSAYPSSDATAAVEPIGDPAPVANDDEALEESGARPT